MHSQEQMEQMVPVKPVGPYAKPHTKLRNCLSTCTFKTVIKSKRKKKKKSTIDNTLYF